MARTLVEAIKARDIQSAKQMLAADPRAAEERDEDDLPVLLLALYYRQPLIAEEIMRHRTDLDIFEASAAGLLPRIRDLVAADSTLVNAYAPDGFTPLGLSAYFQRRETVEFLLTHHADPNLGSRNATQVRPLQSAVAGGPDAEIVRILLDAGAAVDARQRHGFTALHSAAMNGVLAQVELLLARGADVDAATDDGQTPRDYARKGGHDVVVALLSRGRVGSGP